MGRKKKSKKKKPPQHVALTPEEEATVTSILQASEKSDPAELVTKIPDSRHAQAIIERISADKNPSISLLLILQKSFEDKHAQKAIKKALFKLGQKGTPVDEFSKTESASPLLLKPYQEAKSRAFLGPILNLFGSRAVYMTHERTPQGQYMGLGLVSDQDGFHDFLYGTFSKKRSKRMKAHLSEETGPLVETSLSHVATILESAYHRHLEIHPKAPPFYPDLRPWLLENAPLLDRPVILDLIPEDQVANKILTNSQLEGLFKHRLMETWLVEFKRLQPVMEDLLKTDDSPILLSGSQKLDQTKRIKEKCLEELFPESERMLLKQRLEEMAFILFRLENEENARICFHAARTIDQEEDVLQKNHVIEFIVDRSVDFYMNPAKGGISEAKEKEDKSPPSIILP